MLRTQGRKNFVTVEINHSHSNVKSTGLLKCILRDPEVVSRVGKNGEELLENFHLRFLQT